MATSSTPGPSQHHWQFYGLSRHLVGGDAVFDGGDVQEDREGR
jgi:hypothetical protein